jgi:hypothetical protein
MVINDVRYLRDGHLHQFQAVLLYARSPSNDGIFDKFRGNIHPINADVVAVVGIMQSIIV